MNFIPSTQLLSLPEIIDGPGEYLTRCGETVTVHTFEPRGGWSKIRAFGNYHIPSAIPESWYACGRIFGSIESSNDIVAKCTKV